MSPAHPGVARPAASGAATRVFAVLGDPVAHSLSPRVQNAAFEAAGVDGVYVALRCAGDALPGLLTGLARAGGGGNVTLPHKEAAARLVEAPSEAVVRTRACNTFWLSGGRVHGDNTDVAGFQRALGHLLGDAPAGLRVLLLGAGGAARAALAALQDDGAAEIVILNRTPGRAHAVARDVGGQGVRVVEGSGAVDDARFDLVVNTTRLGLEPSDPLPIDLGRLGAVGRVMDVVYGTSETAFVSDAVRRGIPALDGGEMLVQQGAVAFERWWGAPAPLAVMRDALARARGR